MKSLVLLALLLSCIDFRCIWDSRLAIHDIANHLLVRHIDLLLLMNLIVEY